MAQTTCCSMPQQQTGTNPSSWTTVLAPLAGGMLCSGCCVVQLLFNALSLGCAGFAVLEPYRPYFRAITAVALMHMFFRRGIKRNSLLILFMTVALAISQEMLAGYNQGRLPMSAATHSGSVATSTAAPSNMHVGLEEVAIQEPAASHLQQLEFRVLQMKCEGCAAHLRTQLNKLPEVSCTVDFAQKKVTLYADLRHHTHETLASAIRDVDDKYEPVLISQTTHEHTEQ